MDAADLARVGSLVEAPAHAGRPFGFTSSLQLPAQQTVPMVAHCKPDGSLMVARENQATVPTQSGKTASPEAARAAGLFLAGNDLPAIVFELRGVKSNEGRRYQAALAEITALVRQAMRGE